MLTKEYEGVVISDFLSAYDKSGKRRQRCLVHLMRDMKKYKEIGKTEETDRAYKKLRRLIKDAYRLDRLKEKMEPWILYRRIKRLKERLWKFTIKGIKDKNWTRIKKRLLKYQEEIFTFLEVKEVSPDNNHVERMIKPNVIMRKISFQNMSETGAKTHEVLMSLLQTLNLQNQDSKSFFTKAYLKHRQGNPEPILSF